MLKMKCPVCNFKMPDKAAVFQNNTYECGKCKASLKVSRSYRIAYFIMLSLGSFSGVYTINLIEKNTIMQKFVICPLFIGAFVGIATFLCILLYPYKLSNKYSKGMEYVQQGDQNGKGLE